MIDANGNLIKREPTEGNIDENSIEFAIIKKACDLFGETLYVTESDDVSMKFRYNGIKMRITVEVDED